jgi:cytochrome c553
MKWLFAAPVLLAGSLAMAANLRDNTGAPSGSVDVSACQSCHGVDGIATVAGAPNLAGQNARYLEAQLSAFRSKARTNDLMNAIAGQLGDAEIKQLAAYWSSLPAGGKMDDASRRAGAVKTNVSFPSDFPAGFVIYKADEDLAAKTIVRTWANRPALDAARAAKPLPETAVIVAETLMAHDNGGRLIAGSPTGYAVFAAGNNWGDTVPALLRNGNWHFGSFASDRSPRLNNQAACLACHKPQAAQSFMFTYAALEKKARE